MDTMLLHKLLLVKIQKPKETKPKTTLTPHISAGLNMASYLNFFPPTDHTACYFIWPFMLFQQARGFAKTCQKENPQL